MFSSSSRKPFTAVTVLVDRLTAPEVEDDDLSGIVDLLEAIRLQDTGPAEAARAVRKKLKYGNTHRQLRALTILDGLIQNGGGRLQRTLADEALLERLRILPRDDMVDAEVREKCNILFRQWAHHYKNTPGLGGIAALHKQLPTKKRPTAAQSKVLRETERDVENENPFGTNDIPSELEVPVPQDRRKSSISRPSPVSASSSSSRQRALSSTPSPITLSSVNKKDKKSKGRKFDLEKEKTNIMQTIASSSVASTNLLNGLKLINREHTQPSEDQEVMKRFETCKALRRQVLRYIQLVESEQWIGSLLSANDELIRALIAFEMLDKSLEDDSDSETEIAVDGVGASHARRPSRMDEQLEGLTLKEAAEEAPMRPPRPRQSSLQAAPAFTTPRYRTPSSRVKDDEDNVVADENDPFGDQHAF